jgi:hypothetical protein
MAPRDPQVGQSRSTEPTRLEPKERREKLTAAFVGLVVFVVSVPLYLFTLSKLRHPDIPPSFIRIGGESRIETAVEVASFWPMQPPKVVVVGRDAPASTMLDAAECAATLNAPVLFRPASGKLSAPARRMLNDRAISAKPLGKGSMEPTVVEIVQEDQWNETSCQQGPRSSHSLKAKVLAAEPPSSGAGPNPPSLDDYVSDLIQEPSDWKYSRPRRIIFATTQHNTTEHTTTQHKLDVPDVAVAIALAVHLNATLDLRRASAEQGRGKVALCQSRPFGRIGLRGHLVTRPTPCSAEHFTVVRLPRYLQADPGLADALRDYGRKVKEAYVIGGPDAISNSLRDQLKAAIVPLDRLTLWQTIRDIVERVLVVVVPIALVLLSAKTVSDFLEAQGKGPLTWPTLREALLPKKPPPTGGESQDDRPSYPPKDDRSSSLPKFARVRLKSPPRWIIGSSPDQDPSAWPRAQVAAVRLTSLVKADPNTGFVRLGSDEQPILQKEELIVPWSEVQFLELADDLEPWRGPGPTDGKQPGTLLYDLIQEFVTTYSSSSAKRSRRPG